MSVISNPLTLSCAPERPWQSAYLAVEQTVRAYLEAGPHDVGRSTMQLVDAIYPPLNADLRVRKRIFKALNALADRGLARYVTFGPLEKIGRVMGQRKTWHYPKQEVIAAPRGDCPTCKRPL